MAVRVILCPRCRWAAPLMVKVGGNMERELLDEAMQVYRRYGDMGLLMWYDSLSPEEQEQFKEKLRTAYERVQQAVIKFAAALEQNLADVEEET